MLPPIQHGYYLCQVSKSAMTGTGIRENNMLLYWDGCWRYYLTKSKSPGVVFSWSLYGANLAK